MRCPKCGYNSFDHLDSCKKCGKDLVEFKQRFGIKSVLFPGKGSSGEPLLDDIPDEVAMPAAVSEPVTGDEPVAAAPAGMDADFTAEPAADEGVSGADDFGFDFMGDSAEDDDLSFDELFEEAAEEEDVEESLEGPAGDSAGSAEEAEDTFDIPDAEDELDDDFGFDVEEDSADKGDPKDPFDLPESAQEAWAPEAIIAAEPDTPEESVLATPLDTDIVAETVVPEALEALDIADPTVGGEDEIEPSAVADLVLDSVAEVALPVAAEPVVEPEMAADLVFDSAAEGEVPAAVESVVVPDMAVEEAEDTADSADEAVASFEEEGPAEEEPAAVLLASANADAPLAEVEPLLPDDAVEEDADDIDLLPEERPRVASRILAFVYDFTLLLIASIIFIAVAEAAVSSGQLRLFPSAETLVDLSIPYFLVIFALVFGYFTLFHFLTGQTPGKMLTALRVESLEREPLTLGQAFLRSVGGLVQVVPVGLGFLSVLIYPHGRGLSDRLAGTLVINIRESVE